MELKRILARDTRSAMEQAIQTYGPDVLVISNHQVGGQTELVVAIEVPELAITAVAEPVASTDLLINPPAISFRQSLEAASQPQAPAPAQTPVHAPVQAQAPAQPAPQQAAALVDAAAIVAPVAAPSHNAEQDARDYLRSREIVDLVRDEIAALRREFRMRQQTSAWQSNMNFAPALAPLVQALQDASMPGALRALLLDCVGACADTEQALQALRTQLIHHLQRPQAALPLQGLHLLAGPSGAGKTLMTARLAQLAAQSGSEQVAIISYQDARAGAWSQTQMLAAQLGVDAYRASDAQNLRLLVNELSNRKLVLIDTAGVQMSEQVTQILSQAPSCQAHAVLPADASSATLERVLGQGLPFQSLLLTKVDEASSAWPLLQFLGDNGLAISGASRGARLSDLTPAFPIEQLVDFALAPLIGVTDCPTPAIDPQLAPATPMPLASRSEATCLSDTLAAIANLPSLPTFLSTAQVLGAPESISPRTTRAGKAKIEAAQPVKVSKTSKAAKTVQAPAQASASDKPATSRKTRVTPAKASAKSAEPVRTVTSGAATSGARTRKTAAAAAAPV
jgi:flagellar biosynthesis protein FlhF